MARSSAIESADAPAGVGADGASAPHRRRIWGWMLFDWAQQPFYTLGLTFIFGPYFAFVATELFMAGGLSETAADARAQSYWSAGQSLAGLVIAFSAPLLGAWADRSGRKMPWIVVFSAIYMAASWSIWWLTPDGAHLILILVLFYVGFIAAETVLNFTNAILPSLGTRAEVGRISGSGAALGYWGGVVSLFIMLLLFVENETTGLTLLGNPPLFFDASRMEGTRFAGPFIAIWYFVFILPFLLWVRDGPRKTPERTTLPKAWADLKVTIGRVVRRKSLLNFLIASMLYRDALNALYAFGGVYAKLVLDWETINIGIFGIVGAVTAAVATWIGGLCDARFGPKPVIKVCVVILILVSSVIVGMSRESLFGLPLPPGSTLPDIIFYICGAAIGGAGGAMYSASRSMMVRHTEPGRPTEAFGFFALTGKATAFLAPALIFVFTLATGSNQLGFLPVIALFLAGLVMLRFVHEDGDQPA